MEIQPPLYPEYRDAGEEQTHDYRVVFWHHQLPPPGYSPERMGWAELTLDVVDAADVHEVIAWAENYLVEFAMEYPGQEHTYLSLREGARRNVAATHRGSRPDSRPRGRDLPPKASLH